MNTNTRVVVGRGSCGIAAGAGRISDLFVQGVSKDQLDCEVDSTGCIGMCYLEPIVEVYEGDAPCRTYVKVDDAGVEAILAELGGQKDVANAYLISDEDMNNLTGQHRIALRNCGVIDPDSIDEYIARDGYKALDMLRDYSRDDVIGIVKTSGLGGRGGAGFPTWFKWNAAQKSPGHEKYVICNADEGDPGAFMDRALLEGDPHAVIEGMLIAAYAINSGEGVVYVRAEYPLAIQRLQRAIDQALERGFLGDNIMGTGYRFNLRIKAGAGAFVCGEETALIASLEGERGMPRLKPPFPAEKGYWQKPSNINNVETYANVPWIIRNGGEAFAALGTENSKGTKVFALTGKVAKGGLVEIPMGSTIREVIYGPGGGIRGGKAFKAVQMGGPSGGCIPAELIDTQIDYRSLAATGAIMGSGGMVVMDETTCMVDMARFFLDFTCKESCGKCIHCRIGTKRMLEILTRITEGEGREGDIELLEELALQVREGSLCGLGQTAPNPVLTTLRYFRHEYEDHVHNKHCTAHQCTALLSYSIDADKCTGCTLCARKCPVDAIAGEVKKTHVIDMDKCIKCGNCATVCRFGAVVVD
ncbi:MAG: NADH-ubiquinone oxidoreductase-F iron-sulfur binding region domain-containing protein [Oscillospiraceae bacterium]